MWFGRQTKKLCEQREFRWLYSAERFREAMERERARADRWEQPLSLLSFGTAGDESDRRTLARVAWLLQRRIRSTDEAGWLDRGHIGILMPNTPGWGAWTVADEICMAFRDGAPLPECRVYCYPSDWFVSGRGLPGRWNDEPVEQGSNQAMEPFFFRSLPVWKRAVDILGAVLFLLTFAPLYVLIALLVKMTSRGPLLFCQTRVGLGGRHFTMYKFRTMVENAEALRNALRHRNEQEGPVFKVRNDPRVTFLGRFLRKFSLDEFPQMWNVLVGDMSLVGPRPPVPGEVAQYKFWQLRRLYITPGLTCLWQVSGRSKVSFTQWMRMDLRYIAQRSPWTDVKLLAETVPATILGHGAY